VRGNRGGVSCAAGMGKYVCREQPIYPTVSTQHVMAYYLGS